MMLIMKNHIDVQDMVDECDWDGDGQLNFDEFALIMMGKTELDEER